jgi:hypothetical protein
VFPVFHYFARAGSVLCALDGIDEAVTEMTQAGFLEMFGDLAQVLSAESAVVTTSQVREFLGRHSSVAGTDDCVLPAGVYVVGPGHHLMLRRVERPVKFDQFPVTAARYKRFLEAVARHGSARWDHPAMPSGFAHQPWHERLRVPGYYDPACENHPAIAINWWSAYAFARFEGKRLPTSLEWEGRRQGF